MKNGLLYFVFFLSVSSINALEVMNLHDNWSFRCVDDDQWRSAQVPGTVHQDLLRHQLLPDPFYGTNEKKVQWVEEKNWEYRTHFVLSSEQLNHDAIELVFDGLDTYADVYLNGTLLLRSDNMFVGYELDVRSVVHEGENLLHILFHSPIRLIIPQWESTGFNYPADNDHHEKKLSVYTRKAPYSYGWDWGIRLVTSGVWRPVSLRMFNIASIEDVHHQQLSLTDENAHLKNTIELRNVSSEVQQLKLELRYMLDTKVVVQQDTLVRLSPGVSEIDLFAAICHPQRWMPRGWGDPVLYQQDVILSHKGQEVSRFQQRIGLRTVRLINEPDEWGESFYFEVNGEPLYAKGANYIPSDALLPSVTPERYRLLFENITEANMNMVRVWGGGVYEDDLFYELADENGILVWQDFMFACTTYPHDAAFLSRVEEEASYNIRRLRNHASLAIWCGNNEIMEGLHYWGWSRRFNEQAYQGMFEGYDRLFRNLLPSMVAELDAGRSYIHGSPLSANWGRPESWSKGDSHNWGVWYGQKPFESFEVDRARFLSEFGFQSFPEMKTIATFADSADYEIESEVMNAHQKSSIGNALIRKYMERDYIVPERFEDFVYVGLVLQGRGMRFGFEAQRRHRPYCMGTLYWQLNDTWPVVSWSSIDYYNNWKALHYQAANAFAPVLISPLQRNDSLMVYVVNDYLHAFDNVVLELQWITFEGERLRTLGLEANIPANNALQLFAGVLDLGFADHHPNEVFLLMQLKDRGGKELAKEVHFFTKTKDLNLPQPRIRTDLKMLTKGVYQLGLSSLDLAKDVFVEVPVQGARFSDNFFDLLPGETKTIRIQLPGGGELYKDDLKINHIRSTYP